jgi:hypothetical protein
LTIIDIAVHSRDGRIWCQMPGKPRVGKDGMVLRGDDGKVRYTPVIAWKDKVTASRFAEGIAAELIRVHGAAVLDGE